MKSKFFVFVILSFFWIDIQALPIPCESSFDDVVFVSDKKKCPPGYFLIEDEKWKPKDFSETNLIDPEIYNLLMKKMHFTALLSEIDSSLSDVLPRTIGNDSLEKVAEFRDTPSDRDLHFYLAITSEEE